MKAGKGMKGVEENSWDRKRAGEGWITIPSTKEICVPVGLRSVYPPDTSGIVIILVKRRRLADLE